MRQRAQADPLVSAAWSVRRDGTEVGTAWTIAARGRSSALLDLDVPVDDAEDAREALAAALKADGDTPVAILWVHADGPVAFIYDIEVHEDQRRRGYGREVLDAAAVGARGLGAEVLGLNVFGPNDSARALYERAGYLITQRSFRIRL